MNSPLTMKSLLNASLKDIQSALDQGTLTSAQLVLLYLERIARYDRSGPTLNSVIEVNPDAYQIAQALDQERQLRGARGPLHGIPILIKDNIATGDKMHTSAGSLALASVYAPSDAYLVERLRAQGAIILGKTNLTEWANFMTENMPNGYSSRGGQVKNPYGPGRIDTGGSSSGSGAAIAQGLATLAIGTETSGSILSPSSQHSLVGIKPTVGLISRFGIVPISQSQDTAGPMARTVYDAATALGALTGYDPRDPATGSSEGRAQVDYTTELREDGLRGMRLGVPQEEFTDSLTASQTQLLHRAITDLRRLGASVVDPVEIPSGKEQSDYTVLVYEFKATLNAYLSWLGDRTPVHTLREVMEFNQGNADRCLQFGQVQMEKAEATSGTLTEPEYIRARTRDLKLATADGIDRAMNDHRLDALVFVATQGAAIAARAGYPSITVPMGYTDDGEPVGLTFTARSFEESKLIRMAYAFEQGTQYRIAPNIESD